MDNFTVALLVIAAVGLSAILWIAATALMHIRSRRERLQMRRHVQAIDSAGWNEVHPGGSPFLAKKS
jgi:hypothetical protein